MAKTTVLIACFAGAELLDIAGPTGVFSTASSLLGRGRGYDVRLVAQSAGPVVTSSGVTLLAQQALGSIRGAIDTLIVPGGPGQRRPWLREYRVHLVATGRAAATYTVSISWFRGPDC